MQSQAQASSDVPPQRDLCWTPPRSISPQGDLYWQYLSLLSSLPVRAGITDGSQGCPYDSMGPIEFSTDMEAKLFNLRNDILTRYSSSGLMPNESGPLVEAVDYYSLAELGGFAAFLEAHSADIDPDSMSFEADTKEFSCVVRGERVTFDPRGWVAVDHRAAGSVFRAMLEAPGSCNPVTALPLHVACFIASMAQLDTSQSVPYALALAPQGDPYETGFRPPCGPAVALQGVAAQVTSYAVVAASALRGLKLTHADGGSHDMTHTLRATFEARGWTQFPAVEFNAGLEAVAISMAVFAAHGVFDPCVLLAAVIYSLAAHAVPRDKRLWRHVQETGSIPVEFIVGHYGLFPLAAQAYGYRKRLLPSPALYSYDAETDTIKSRAWPSNVGPMAFNRVIVSLEKGPSDAVFWPSPRSFPARVLPLSSFDSAWDRWGSPNGKKSEAYLKLESTLAHRVPLFPDWFAVLPSDIFGVTCRGFERGRGDPIFTEIIRGAFRTRCGLGYAYSFESSLFARVAQAFIRVPCVHGKVAGRMGVTIFDTRGWTHFREENMLNRSFGGEHVVRQGNWFSSPAPLVKASVTLPQLDKWEVARRTKLPMNAESLGDYAVYRDHGMKASFDGFGPETDDKRMDEFFQQMVCVDGAFGTFYSFPDPGDIDVEALFGDRYTWDGESRFPLSVFPSEVWVLMHSSVLKNIEEKVHRQGITVSKMTSNYSGVVGSSIDQGGTTQSAESAVSADVKAPSGDHPNVGISAFPVADAGPPYIAAMNQASYAQNLGCATAVVGFPNAWQMGSGKDDCDYSSLPVTFEKEIVLTPDILPGLIQTFDICPLPQALSAKIGDSFAPTAADYAMSRSKFWRADKIIQFEFVMPVGAEVSVAVATFYGSVRCPISPVVAMSGPHVTATITSENCFLEVEVPFRSVGPYLMTPNGVANGIDRLKYSAGVTGLYLLSPLVTAANTAGRIAVVVRSSFKNVQNGSFGTVNASLYPMFLTPANDANRGHAYTGSLSTTGTKNTRPAPPVVPVVKEEKEPPQPPPRSRPNRVTNLARLGGPRVKGLPVERQSGVTQLMPVEGTTSSDAAISNNVLAQAAVPEKMWSVGALLAPPRLLHTAVVDAGTPAGAILWNVAAPFQLIAPAVAPVVSNFTYFSYDHLVVTVQVIGSPVMQGLVRLVWVPGQRPENATYLTLASLASLDIVPGVTLNVNGSNSGTLRVPYFDTRGSLLVADPTYCFGTVALVVYSGIFSGPADVEGVPQSFAFTVNVSFEGAELTVPAPTEAEEASYAIAVEKKLGYRSLVERVERQAGQEEWRANAAWPKSKDRPKRQFPRRRNLVNNAARMPARSTVPVRRPVPRSRSYRPTSSGKQPGPAASRKPRHNRSAAARRASRPAGQKVNVRRQMMKEEEPVVLATEAGKVRPALPDEHETNFRVLGRRGYQVGYVEEAEDDRRDYAWGVGPLFALERAADWGPYRGRSMLSFLAAPYAYAYGGVVFTLMGKNEAVITALPGAVGNFNYKALEGNLLVTHGWPVQHVYVDQPFCSFTAPQTMLQNVYTLPKLTTDTGDQHTPFTAYMRVFDSQGGDLFASLSDSSTFSQFLAIPALQVTTNLFPDRYPTAGASFYVDSRIQVNHDPIASSLQVNRDMVAAVLEARCVGDAAPPGIALSVTFDSSRLSLETLNALGYPVLEGQEIIYTGETASRRFDLSRLTLWPQVTTLLYDAKSPSAAVSVLGTASVVDARSLAPNVVGGSAISVTPGQWSQDITSVWFNYTALNSLLPFPGANYAVRRSLAPVEYEFQTFGLFGKDLMTGNTVVLRQS